MAEQAETEEVRIKVIEPLVFHDYEQIDEGME
jgi:hypothetical protein